MSKTGYLVISIIIIILLIILFFVTYALNKKTPKPEESKINNCLNCQNVMCSQNQNKLGTKEKD